MAICHFKVKTISRAKGSRVVAAAAYRSGSRLHDESLGKTFDFTQKPNVIHSEILAPFAAAASNWPDQERLWNGVEAAERRRDAQLAREIVVAIPREFDQSQGVALVRDFVMKNFIEKGMIADLNIHWDAAKDGKPNPHAHIMLTMRGVVETPGSVSFGHKVRAWNKLPTLMEWRQAWAEQINDRLAREGIDARVDHRRNRDRGIVLEPQRHLSLAAFGLERRGKLSAEVKAYRDTARRNGEALIADPAVGLSALTHQRATFSYDDLARFAQYHSDSNVQFDQVLGALERSPALISLGRGERNIERYTSSEMVRIEQALDYAACELAQGRSHEVASTLVATAAADSAREGLTLSKQQLHAVRFMTRPHRLSAIIGYAGAGKTAALSVAKRAWIAQGYRVQGAALAGIAAENLQRGAAIPSKTLASLEYAWSKGRGCLGPQDVLVIDEAGLVGSRQMQSVIEEVRRAGAKVVLLGDVEQLQAIDAGAAFRLIAERYGAAEITEIRRQVEPWQAAATKALGDGQTEAALGAYLAAGMIHSHENTQLAKQAMIDAWAADWVACPTRNHLLFGFSRNDVASLNVLARDRLRAEGLLGAEYRFNTPEGDRLFAINERVFFRKNILRLGVRNGTAGTIAAIEGAAVVVNLDHGGTVRVDLRTFSELDYGYATTIHRAQGLTVDHAYLLASGAIDRHAAYVGLSRHRHSVSVHYGGDQFSSYLGFSRAFSRDRPKDMALDYIEAFTDHREITPHSHRASPATMLERTGSSEDCRKVASVFARYLSTLIDLRRTRRHGLTVTVQQKRDIEYVAEQVDSLWPGSARNLTRTIDRNPEITKWIFLGRADLVVKALLDEHNINQSRTPNPRRSRFKDIER